jgi:hypothetical protein
MMRHCLITVLALSMLVGCGTSPTAIGGASRLETGAKALVDTSRHRHALVVPADVMAFADDYMTRQHAKYDKGGTAAHLGLKLVASADNFKSNFEAAVDRFNPRNGGGPQTFMLDENVPTGQLEYYLVVTGTVVTQARNSLKMDALPDFYVSNFGKNWRATVK